MNDKRTTIVVENGELEQHSKTITQFLTGKDNHVKSHDMVFASLELTPRMADILALLFTKMRAEDFYYQSDISQNIPSQPRYEFTPTEIKEFLCLKSSKHVASLIQPSAKRLSATSVGIENDKGEFDYASLFSRIRYENQVLTIIPNMELKESYIAKAKSKGYALINNEQYLALKDIHSKKTLDLLSRYKSGQRLYPISIKKLQLIYGVIGQDGAVLKPTYLSPKTFVKRVIAPSLVSIAQSQESKNRITILESDHNTLGYELVEDDRGEFRVRFLYKWHSTYSDEDVAEANKRIEELLLFNLQLKDQDKSLDPPLLRELLEACSVVESDSKDMAELVAPIIEQAQSKLKQLEQEEQKRLNQNGTQSVNVIKALVEKGGIDL
jgi:hypothetical protein